MNKLLRWNLGRFASPQFSFSPFKWRLYACNLAMEFILVAQNCRCSQLRCSRGFAGVWAPAHTPTPHNHHWVLPSPYPDPESDVFPLHHLQGVRRVSHWWEGVSNEVHGEKYQTSETSSSFLNVHHIQVLCSLVVLSIFILHFQTWHIDHHGHAHQLVGDHPLLGLQRGGDSSCAQS